MNTLKLFVLVLLVYLVTAIIAPVKAILIYSIVSAYVYICITGVMMFVVDVALAIRSIF